MNKRTSVRRLSSSSQLASTTIDLKARKQIENLYDLTDELINAYNEINEKYVHQIYRKYKQLQEINKKLKQSLNHHHCAGCKCNEDKDDDEEEEEEESSEEDDEQAKNSTIPSSTTNSIITRSKRNNPFIISDIEETQNFNGNDSRFNKNSSDDEADKISMDTDQATHQTKTTTESSDEDEVEDDNGMEGLPIALQNVIQNKAKRKKNAKAYLLEIPRYPALCEYLRDKSRTSFDHRPSEDQVRSFITNHIGKHQANDSKFRMRIRDELREIHRSYMRTFMTDPHAAGPKGKLPVKKSPV